MPSSGKAWSDWCLRACTKCIENKIPYCTHKQCAKCPGGNCQHGCHS